jgi:hypothetical protein
MDAATKAAKAFDFAQDVAKQVITLAAGVLTITVTFHGDLAKSSAHHATWPLQWGWVCLAVSIGGGVWTLMALTGTVDSSKSGSIFDANVRIPAGVQLLAFAAGMALTTVFAWNALM